MRTIAKNIPLFINIDKEIHKIIHTLTLKCNVKIKVVDIKLRKKNGGAVGD